MAERSGEAGPGSRHPSVSRARVSLSRGPVTWHVADVGPVTGCSGGGRVTGERGPGAYVTLGYEIRRTEHRGSRLVMGEDRR